MESDTISVQLNPETERRLSDLARKSECTQWDCARKLIQSNLEDLEDRYIADHRLQQNLPSLSSSQVRKELGLED